MKKMTQICQISNKKGSRSSDFYDKFRQVAKHKEGPCFFFFFYFHIYSVTKSG
jgi:hypothetical protein